MAKGKVKEGRVKTKDMGTYIEKFMEITKNLRELVNSMPDSSFKDAAELSAQNMEKKVERFQPTERFSLSNEEKEAIRKLRAGEAKITPVKRKED